MTGILIKSAYFAGGGRLFGAGPLGLSAVIRAQLQWAARISASAVAALVDNSGASAANGTIEAVPAFTLAVQTNAGVQKAEFDAAIATVRDGICELIAQSSALAVKVPAFAALVDNTGGPVADGTLDAVSHSFTAVATSFASAASANTILAAYKNAFAQLAVFANKLAVASGVTGVIDLSGGVVTYATLGTFPVLSVTSVTAVSGADITAANAGFTKVQGDLTFGVLANAAKEIATVLNACRSATGGTIGAVAI